VRPISRHFPGLIVAGEGRENGGAGGERLRELSASEHRISTTAQNSPRVLASAKNRCKNAVFPQEAPPNTSLIAPWGKSIISPYVRL